LRRIDPTDGVVADALPVHDREGGIGSLREPPRLSDERIRDSLGVSYGISVDEITFLPLGADSSSAAYRIRTSGGGWFFLKVRKGEGFDPRSLVVPCFLSDQGVPHILAPLKTASRNLWIVVDGFGLSLFPFIEGRRAADIGLSEEQWMELGATARQIHDRGSASDISKHLPREKFVPTRRELLNRLQEAVAGADVGDSAREDLATFWRSRERTTRQLVGRCDELGRRLRGTFPPLALCHADLHTWNVLVDPSGGFWIVDWDETILAMKERDLMFVVGGIGPGLVRPDETASFLRGYGQAEIDPLALTYYRYAWALQDMAAYGEQVFFIPDQADESRRDAVQGFKQLFEPGEIVDIALGSDPMIDA
jgi:spectinomycin phosphotransferase